MKEIFELAFSSVNIIPSTLLVFILLYWLIVIVGLLDTQFLHFEVADTGSDIHFDTNADTHIETHIDGGGLNALNAILAFFNMGKVPFMFFMSFLALPLWVISILANYYLSNHSFLMSLPLLLGNIIISLFIAKFLTTPFTKLFAKMDLDTTDESMVGKIATLLLPITGDKFGQAEIIINGSPIVVNVKSVDNQLLERGEKALVIDYLETEKMFLVEAYKD